MGLKYELNPQGNRVRKSIEDFLLENVEVSSWIEAGGSNCSSHRSEILKLYLNAKIFQAVKLLDETFKKRKSMKSTVQDLRFQ